MSKEKSLVKHILMNVFCVTIVVVTIVLVITWLIMCRNYKEKIQTEMHATILQKVEDIRFDLKNQIYKTDHITGNPEITDKLDVIYEDGYELMKFISELNTFMDALEQVENDLEQILIYTTNTSLVESRYLRNIERMPKYKERLNYFKKTKQYLYWDNNIYTDNFKRQYVVLLRNLPLENECIIEIRLYFEEELPDSDIIDKCSFLTGQELKGQKNIVSENVFEDFYLMAQIPMGKLYSYYINCLLRLLFGAIVFLIIALILASVSIKHAMKDIMFLVEQIDGKECLLGGESSVSKWLELRKIQNKIFSLNKQIYEMNIDKYEDQLLKKKLEIENLNLKINPHLLYNSLSVIKMGAFKKCDYETERIVELLVDYYRLMLNKGEEKIMLGQELEYLEKYIKINEISKKSYYEVEVDIPNNAYNVLIPHLILQPIVENAIFHGFNGISENCAITFVARYSDRRLNIIIKDNGVGIDAERLNKMNEGMELGYGLKNVYFRLSYYYENNFELKFDSELGKGTQVSLIIDGLDA